MDILKDAQISALIERLHTGKQPLDDERRETLRHYLTTATELVYGYLGNQWVQVPESVMDTVLTTVARDLETREKSPGGVFAAFGEHDSAIRLARDPLTPVYPILQRYASGGFA